MLPARVIFPILSACSALIELRFFRRTADFHTLHYNGRAGGSRTLQYGFPLLTRFDFLAGGRFDPQELGIGLVLGLVG